VKNFATGRLPVNSSRKSSQDKTPSSLEYQRLIATFQRIATISDPIERRFELNRAAPNHDLPRNEMRIMFREWFLGGVA
jgi:hypothetical protein